MPASWRPSRGPSSPDHDLDEIRALAGVDRMTIPAPLLEKLKDSQEELPRALLSGGWNSPDSSKIAGAEIGGGSIDEKTFRYHLNMDGCGTDKLAEGLRSFIDLTEQLEVVIREKVGEKVAGS